MTVLLVHELELKTTRQKNFALQLGAVMKISCSYELVFLHSMNALVSRCCKNIGRYRAQDGLPEQGLVCTISRCHGGYVGAVGQ